VKLILFDKNLREMHNKWNNKKFVEEQLVNHLIEVKELIETKDSHTLSECIDLINIVARYIDIRSNEKEQLEGFKNIMELAKHRYSKFYENRNR